jgi:hypothetical protein
LIEKQDEKAKKELTDILYNDYRTELLKRLKEGGKEALGNQALINTIIDLTKIKNKVGGWQPVGSPKPADRIWHYMDIDPMTEKDENA